MESRSLGPVPTGTAPLVVPPAVSVPILEASAPCGEDSYPDSLPQVEVSSKELALLCAQDQELYNRTFFPNTFRQKSPPFHQEIYHKLDLRDRRLFAAKVFRGGAKTTILRAYASRRIAYGISRTVLLVGKSQDHAIKSLRWVKRAVEYNRLWAQFYGLERGEKWSEDVAEIRHTTLGLTITVLAYGLTGPIRGINIDDYRPDLIILDDPQDEESAATEEQRRKVSDLVFGALAQSLAPASECPDAKLVLLQTPLHKLDLISSCEQDPAWDVVSYGILDDDEQSVWPERWSTREVTQERQEYANRNQLPLWLREKMVKIVAAETSDFRSEWLEYWDILPPRLVTFLGIDPVPPPSERELQQGLRCKDFEVISAIGLYKGGFYLLALDKSRGHNPDWTIAKFFEYVDRFSPRLVTVEGIAYQRTLKWILEQAMHTRRRWVQIRAESDRRPKSTRIRDAFTGIASNHRLFVNKAHLDFINQFISYPNVEYDDVLDSVAIALKGAQEYIYADEDTQDLNEEEYPALPNWRAAP